ncbi:MAG: hypothetical protein Q9225_008076, partial [Loekoesia sp. 1 TL-2023]
EDAAAGEADSIADISFSIPQRKKLKLELGRNSDKGAIRACQPTSREAEFSVRWQDVEYCVCLPVPEKAQPQYNYCIFPRSTEEQILFTVPGTKVKPETIQSDSAVDPEESYKSVVTRMLNRRLNNKVLEPDEREFVSQVAQAHRKGEKAVHVKAFRGSKDGFLFFLSAGIVWGFKKPLSFFPFHSISSISYTSVLQRTFNLNLSVLDPLSSSNEPQEFEFSMIDQADFAGIDAYVKRHELQDASMAEQRRAKRLNINGVMKNAEEGGEEDGDGEGELQKAAREAEEMEDEDEEEDENFDPGSEGESEGSGSSSEEEEDHQGGGEVNGDLVEEELGSEAEDVSE